MNEKGPIAKMFEEMVKQKQPPPGPITYEDLTKAMEILKGRSK